MDQTLPEPRVIGRYLLHGEIASGGMATVHFGKLLGPVGFSRTVAIKRLHAHFAKEPEFVSMFIDEARLAARIQHPNVVSTLDVVAREGELFLVMEYVQGESLARLLRATRESSEPIPVGVAIGIVAGVLDGLHAAHEAKTERGESLGIVHRDISPQNVMVGVDGVARVLDFGVAKAIGRLQTTRDGQIKGKLPYMAPEQLRHQPVDRRTDVYAASVVLWEVLTGRRLFRADNEAALFGMVLDDAVDAPSIHATLPPGLDEVVMRGLSRDPDERFPTAREMALALEKVAQAASPREIGAWVERIASENLKRHADRVAELESASEIRQHAAATPRSSSPAAAAASDSLPPTQLLRAPSRGSRRAPALIVTGVALIALVVVGFALSHGASKAPTPEASAAKETSAAIDLAETAPALQSPPSAAPSAAPPSGSVQPQAGKVRVPATHPSASRQTPSKDCSPPYTLDPQGVQIPKPQCL